MPSLEEMKKESQSCAQYCLERQGSGMECSCNARLWPLAIAEIEAWRYWNDRIMSCPQQPPTQTETNEAGQRVLKARKALEEA
jgi:hypothetical protein